MDLLRRRGFFGQKLSSKVPTIKTKSAATDFYHRCMPIVCECLTGLFSSLCWRWIGQRGVSRALPIASVILPGLRWGPAHGFHTTGCNSAALTDNPVVVLASVWTPSFFLVTTFHPNLVRVDLVVIRKKWFETDANTTTSVVNLQQHS